MNGLSAAARGVMQTFPLTELLSMSTALSSAITGAVVRSFTSSLKKMAPTHEAAPAVALLGRALGRCRCVRTAMEYQLLVCMIDVTNVDRM